MFDTKGATEVGFTCFSLENILSSLALVTDSVNKNLIQPFPLVTPCD